MPRWYIDCPPHGRHCRRVTEGGNGRHGGNLVRGGIRGGLRGVAMLPKHRMGPDACVKVFWHA